MFFFYDIFPEGKKILRDLGVTLHALATWWDVLDVAKKSGKFDKGKLREVEKFMKDPPAGRRRMAAPRGGGVNIARHLRYGRWRASRRRLAEASTPLHPGRTE